MIRLNEDTYESLLQTMADSLSWTASSLRNMTSPYIISALPYPALTHEVFHLLAGCAFLIALVDLIWLFYHSLRHRREPLQLSGEAQQGQQDSSSEQPRTLISHRRKKTLTDDSSHAAFPGIGRTVCLFSAAISFFSISAYQIMLLSEYTAPSVSLKVVLPPVTAGTWAHASLLFGHRS